MLKIVGYVRVYIFEHLSGVKVQRRITRSMNIDGEEDMCDEDAVSEEGGEVDSDKEKRNRNMTVDNMEGVLRYSSGNGGGGWRSLKNIAPSGAFAV